MILAVNSSPRKSFATTFPLASNKKVAGIDWTLYVKAIGSCQYFKCETCGKIFKENGNLKTHLRLHVNLKFIFKTNKFLVWRKTLYL